MMLYYERGYISMNKKFFLVAALATAAFSSGLAANTANASQAPMDLAALEYQQDKEAGQAKGAQLAHNKDVRKGDPQDSKRKAQAEVKKNAPEAKKVQQEKEPPRQDVNKDKQVLQDKHIKR